MFMQNLLHWVTRKARTDLRFIGQMVKDMGRSLEPVLPLDMKAFLSVTEDSFVWLGHSTILIRWCGITILTDPALCMRVGPSLGPCVLGPKRFPRSPILPHELGKIDLLIISHAHFDHLDIGTLTKIPRIETLITPKGTKDILPQGIAHTIKELSWGESFSIDTQEATLNITAFSVNHKGARTRYDEHRTANAYMMTDAVHRFAFLGDTAFTRTFEHVFDPSEKTDTVFTPIGGYNPYIHHHCTPEQALEMADFLKVKKVVAMHHKTFQLSREPMEEPAIRFMEANSMSQEKVLPDIGVINSLWP